MQQAQEGTDEHLIKVYATAPCSGELLWVRNFPQIALPGKIGVPCYDLSGVVITAPANSPFQPGAEVYTRTNAGRTGNAREYTIALTSELALKPKNLSWEEAASVPLSAFTAYQALFEHGGLEPGWNNEASRAENAKKRVLITAASGAVGVWLVQLAKRAGVKSIVGLSGPTNIDFVRSLGVTEAINYKEQSLGAWAVAGNPKADLVIDMQGKQTLADAWTAVKDDGVLISIVEAPENYKPKENPPKDVNNYFFIMKPEGWQLKEVAKLLENDEAKAIVDSVWDFDEFKEAFAKSESGHARGKVIIKVHD